MFKLRDILMGVFLVIIGILCLSKLLCAQEPGVYTVDNYRGGLNVATDGTNLRPDEALVLTNFTLDSVNCLVPRQGFSYWDSVAIDTSEEIDAIYVYEPYDGTQKMIIVSDSFIYISSMVDTVTDAASWPGLRLGFSGDSIRVMLDSSKVWQIHNEWWYANMGQVHEFNVTGDTSSTAYQAAVYGTFDSALSLSPAYNGAIDTTGYTAYLKTHGAVTFTQYRNKLYICNPQDYLGTYIYDDTNYVLLPLLDSGLVSDTIALDTSQFMYANGRVMISVGSRIAYGNDDVDWGANSGVAAGDIFIYKPMIRDYEGNVSEVRWMTSITSIDTLQRTLELNDVYETSGGSHVDIFNPYEIRRQYIDCGPGASSSVAVEDTNKNWDDFIFGDTYLTSFYAVIGRSGLTQHQTIYCNDESTYTIDGKFGPGDNYYIFTGRPWLAYAAGGLDAPREFPTFSQVYFYNDMLYGIGWDYYVGSSYYYSHNNGRVWYSDISIPQYVRYDYNFDLGPTDDATILFGIRNNLIIGTDKSIWILAGTPNLVHTSGNGILRRVVSNMGIPDIDNWAKATEEYGYFTNRTGIYRFNGVRPEKISWKVDPIIQTNYDSRIVMGYKDSRLYISFPDSNFTLVYDERFDAFYQFDFGMTCFYAPPDTNIFYFGHSLYKGRVYYYPNGLYYDNLGDATGTYTTTYESGWQSYGGYWKLKRIIDGFFQVANLVPSTIRIYTNDDNGDFNSSPCDTAMCDSTSRFVYRKQFDSDCVGEYFKVAFVGGPDSSAVFGGYRIDWVEEKPWLK